MSGEEREEWRPVLGGWYEVSSLGRVRRAAPGSNNTWSGRSIVLRSGTNGYLRFNASLGGRNHRKTISVHALVAAAFLKPQPMGSQVNHRDGIKENNAAANLEYVTAKQNVRHGWRIGLMMPRCGAANSSARLTSADVASIRSDLAIGARGTAARLARAYGVTPGTIGMIKRGVTWLHG